MVIRSRYMPHSSMPFTTTSLPTNSWHLPLVWKICIPFGILQDVEFFFLLNLWTWMTSLRMPILSLPSIHVLNIVAYASGV
jgi:hypothetical protein